MNNLRTAKIVFYATIYLTVVAGLFFCVKTIADALDK